jgi:hypothetical protein
MTVPEEKRFVEQERLLVQDKFLIEAPVIFSCSGLRFLNESQQFLGCNFAADIAAFQQTSS